MEPSYRFHQYHLQPALRQLLDDGRTVKLGGRAFDMLLVLVEQRHRTVSKYELMEMVWPKLVVEENNLHVQVAALRKLLGHGAIATVPGRGYRFTLAVQAEGAERASQPPAQAAAASAAPLVGREEELRTLLGLIEGHPVVTVAGAGGIGKTRLAQSAASARAPHQGDGVWWIELAGLSDPALVPMAVGQALGLQLDGQADIAAAVAQALQGKAALLVLDNAEHLLDGVAALVATLRERAASVKLLVTSQEVMRGLDEQVYRPGPLALPASDEMAAVRASGAVALFVARAQQADPRFTLHDENRAAVADICRRLDGIPLAIELAAARVPLLGVEGLRRRLGERFQVLTAGARAVMRRHQTLRAALDWSHGLLDEPERRVLRRLGVFAGGFTLESAQAVADDDSIDAWDVLEHLGALVDKSLVVAEGGELPRYRLLETTRLYALERLAEAGETDDTLMRHARDGLALAQAFDHAAAARGRAAAELRRLDLERDNLLHALAWCATADSEEAALTGLRLAAALRYYWPSRALLDAGVMATQRALERTRGLPGDTDRCQALGSVVQILRWRGPAAAAQGYNDELVALSRQLGHAPGVAVGATNDGFIALDVGDFERAERSFQAARQQALVMGSAHHEGNAMAGLTEVLRLRGRTAEAVLASEEMVALSRRANHGFNLALALLRRCSFAFEAGDRPTAEALMREASPLIDATGTLNLPTTFLCFAAQLQALRGQWADVARLHAAAERGRQLHALPLQESDAAAIRAQLAAARQALGEAEFEACQAAGNTMGFEAAAALARAAALAQP